MEHFYGKDKVELRKDAKEAGHPAFRTDQLLDWVYDKGISDVGAMKNLGKKYIQYLHLNYRFETINILQVKKDSKEETIKFLLELEDGNTVEMVIMRYLHKDHTKERNTLCLSCQVGCPIGCPFCATGQSGLVRNLTTGEIVEQVFIANRYLASLGGRIGNVVFMGMGEPLLNRDAVFKGAGIIRESFGISSRRITISTSGVLEGIREMAKLDLKYVLAISLHGANDELRNRLVPLNKGQGLGSLIKVCKEYQDITRKRITFEYIMIEGQNIQERDARELATLLKGIDCHINGIPINGVPGSEFQRPSRNASRRFMGMCQNLGLSFSIREEKGTDIDGACGQLRNKERKVHESDIG